MKKSINTEFETKIRSYIKQNKRLCYAEWDNFVKRELENEKRNRHKYDMSADEWDYHHCEIINNVWNDWENKKINIIPATTVTSNNDSIDMISLFHIKRKEAIDKLEAGQLNRRKRFFELLENAKYVNFNLDIVEYDVGGYRCGIDVV